MDSLRIFTPPIHLLGEVSGVSSEPDTLVKMLSGRALLFCHHNADPDSICSAYAFKELAETLKPAVDAEIILAGGASSLSKRIMEALRIEASEEASVDEADVLVVLDAGTLGQLDRWGEAVALADVPMVFIDHHAPHPTTTKLAALLLIDEEATSTCEIVYNLYRRYGLKPSANVAKALLIGVAYDSKHFNIGTAKTFRAVSELLEIDGAVEEVVALLASEMDRSERIARLKAGQRMRIHDVEGWTIATSHVSSFQASAARALISLGADVAVVAGGDKGIVRTSLRATDKFHKAISLHLGRDVAMSLGEEFGGSGSGHATSAGVNTKGRSRTMLHRAVELLSAKLREYRSSQAGRDG